MTALTLERWNRGKDTFLYAESGPVNCNEGVTTKLLEFRTPNEPVILRWLVTFQEASKTALDQLTIAWAKNGIYMQKANKTLSTTGEWLENPFVITGVFPPQTLLKVEAQYVSGSLPPSVDIVMNCSAYGQVLREGVKLF